MQDLLLVAAVAATFVFGWFLVKKLEDFMKNSCRQQRQETDEESNVGRRNVFFRQKNADVPAKMYYNIKINNAWIKLRM